MGQFGLLLMQSSDFRGMIVCTPNPPQIPGIWYFNQGIAKPPFPVSAERGSFVQQALGPDVLIQDVSGNLLAVMWGLDYATAQSQATGPFSSPLVNGSWEFTPLPSEKLAREHPELASQLRK